MRPRDHGDTGPISPGTVWPTSDGDIGLLSNALRDAALGEERGDSGTMSPGSLWPISLGDIGLRDVALGEEDCKDADHGDKELLTFNGAKVFRELAYLR